MPDVNENKLFTFEELPEALKPLMQPIREVECTKRFPPAGWGDKHTVYYRPSEAVGPRNSGYSIVSTNTSIDVAYGAGGKLFETPMPVISGKSNFTLLDIPYGSSFEGYSRDLSLNYDPFEGMERTMFNLNKALWLVKPIVKKYFDNGIFPGVNFIQCYIGGELSDYYLMDFPGVSCAIDFSRSGFNWERVYGHDLYRPWVSFVGLVLNLEAVKNYKVFTFVEYKNDLVMSDDVVDNLQALGATLHVEPIRQPISA